MSWEKLPSPDVLKKDGEQLRRSILRLFHRLGPLSPSMISCRLQVSQRFICKTLEQLQARGLAKPKIGKKYASSDEDPARTAWDLS